MGGVTYFRHPTGKVGVSLDDGYSIVLPAGRKVERDLVWAGAGEDLYEQLTPEQRAFVDPVLAEEDRKRTEQAGLRSLADRVNKRRKRPRRLSMGWWVFK